MSYDEFVESCRQLKLDSWYPSEDGIKDKDGLILYHKYETGGYTGGSCWDDDDHFAEPYTVINEDCEFKSLDKVIKHFVPTNTLHYSMLTGLVKTDYETDYEYYGNSTDYEIKYIRLEPFYEALKELGLL